MVLATETSSMLGYSSTDTLYKPLVVVGIHAFNVEKTIARAILSAQKHANVVVVCDDGSTDLTGQIAKRLGAIVVRNDKNLGYGASIHSLFRRAGELKADVFVTLDSDGYYDPGEIPSLVKPIEDRVAEVVFGRRSNDNNLSPMITLHGQSDARVVSKLHNCSTKSNIIDAPNGFIAYSSRALEKIGVLTKNGSSVSIEFLQGVNKSSLNVCQVPIACKKVHNIVEEVPTKNSGSNAFNLVYSIIELIVEKRPLFFGIPGIFSLVGGVFFGVWMMSIYAQTHEIMTNVALFSIAFILAGFFLVSTAITLYGVARLRKKINKQSN